MKHTRALVAVAALVWPGTVVAQGPTPLERAVDRAREAWLDHDLRGLVRHSDTVRLQLPGVGRSPSVRPSQAARVLGDYLRIAEEVTLRLRRIRAVSDDHAYAELVRIYVVQGTRDERVETIFLGFRRIDGIWGLREVRITR